MEGSGVKEVGGEGRRGNGGGTGRFCRGQGWWVVSHRDTQARSAFTSRLVHVFV